MTYFSCATHNQRLPPGFRLPQAAFSITIGCANLQIPHRTTHHMCCTKYLKSHDTQKSRVPNAFDTNVQHALLTPCRAVPWPSKTRAAPRSVPPEHTQRLAAAAGHPGRSQADRARPPARPRRARPHKHEEARDQSPPPPHAADSVATPTAVVPKMPATMAAVDAT